MLAKIVSGTVVGLDGVLVEVEVDLVKKGFPTFTIVGLPGKAVEESRERVKSALLNSSASFPNHRLTVNLAPADLPKQGPAFDLPVALGILVASEQIPQHTLFDDSVFLGELSLDGSLRSVVGVLPVTMMAKEHGYTRVFVPQANVHEAAVVEGIDVIPLESLEDFLEIVIGSKEMQPVEHTVVYSTSSDDDMIPDFAEIYGQEKAKRALEIAAAGAHNILMYGPPGSGKTFLARALPSILPPLEQEEMLVVSKIYSVTGRLGASQPLVTKRPFRSPHHTTSRIGLIGGGQKITPGEITLAHRGILFLDELPEFPRHVLESMRQPLEDGWVQISRANGAVVFPSQFMLVAAANPCPCGNLGNDKKTCVCTNTQISRYNKRLSGPMLDRIDMYIEVPIVDVETIIEGYKGSERETSHDVQERVCTARALQKDRFASCAALVNSEMSVKNIREFCTLDHEPEMLFKQALEKLGLSVRGGHKILKIARTIADLDKSKYVLTKHIAEALSFRHSLSLNQLH